MSKGLVSLLSTVSIVVSILIGVMSIDAAIKNAAITEEARITRLEQTFYVYQEKLDRLILEKREGDKELTKFLFKESRCKP